MLELLAYRDVYIPEVDIKQEAKEVVKAEPAVERALASWSPPPEPMSWPPPPPTQYAPGPIWGPPPHLWTPPPYIDLTSDDGDGGA